MDANLLRTINKLWKDRHTHDGENFQEQITIIRQTVEQQSDTVAGSSTGAHLHLIQTGNQSIAAGGEAIEWDAVFSIIPAFEFDDTVPVTAVPVQKPGYYNVYPQLKWSDYVAGGSVWIVRVRDGVELVVWPTSDDPEIWTSTNGRRFTNVAPAIPLQEGDAVKVYLDHNDASPHSLHSGTLVLELIDHDWSTREPANLGSPEAIQSGGVGATVANYQTGGWDDYAIREPDGVKFDPGSSLWVCAYTGTTGALSSQGTEDETVGIVTSSDAVTWTPASNPVTGATEAEDPYIAKDASGLVYRDGSGVAYMYVEEKLSASPFHQGIDLWLSDANSLTAWTRHGRVIDKGSSGWDSTDRTSPVVIHDGTQFVMLFEGRNLSGSSNLGQIGYATSADGITWSVDASPIIVQGSGGTWNDLAIVCDDVIKIGHRWILITHGNDGSDWSTGRYETTDDPADWDNTSFTEMAGNPFDAGFFIMCWGNDPHHLTYIGAGLGDDGDTSITKRRVEYA